MKYHSFNSWFMRVVLSIYFSLYLFVEVMLLPPALAKLLQIGLLFGLQFTASRLIVFSRRVG